MRRLRAMPKLARFQRRWPYVHVDVLAPLPAPKRPWVWERRYVSVAEAIAIYGDEVEVGVDLGTGGVVSYEEWHRIGDSMVRVQ